MIRLDHVEIVPKIMMSGSGAGAGGSSGVNFSATMLGALLSDKLGVGIGGLPAEAEGSAAK